MKTSKVIDSRQKISRDKESVKQKKVKKNRSWPSEEDIREKAEDFYNQRLDRGEYGTAENDWLNAEKYLTESED